MVKDMKNSHELKKLLQEKEDLFFQIERITYEISEAPIDQINELLDTRGNLLEQVIRSDNKIKSLVDENLKSVLDCSCDISGLSEEQKELFEKALSIKAVVNRIVKNEDIIRLRIENERDSLLKRIETMNNSSKTVAESYKRSVKTGLSQGLGANKKKTV